MGEDSFMGRLKRGLCPNCGEKGPHFVPPSLGDKGFYACEAFNRLTEPIKATVTLDLAPSFVVPDKVGTFGERITCDCGVLTMGPFSGMASAVRMQCSACGQWLEAAPTDAPTSRGEATTGSDE